MPDPLFRAIDEMPRHAYPFLWADPPASEYLSPR